MPIIGHVGRRSLKVRLLNLLIHAVLILGGVTMVYPLLVMLAGSIKSSVDRGKLETIPAYLHDDGVLYKKYIEAKYTERTLFYAYSVKKRLYSFADVTPPDRLSAARVADWNEFLDETLPSLDERYYDLGCAQGPGIIPEMGRLFKRELQQEPDIDGDITRLNAKYGTSFISWELRTLPQTGVLSRESGNAASPLTKRYAKFIDGQKAHRRDYFMFRSLDAFFIEDFLKPNYTSDIRKMNRALGTNFRSWQEVCLSRTLPPEGDGLRADWGRFVKNKLNLSFIRASDEALPAYRRALRQKYDGDIALLSRNYGASYSSFDDIPLPQDTPEGVRFADWNDFITTGADPAHLRIRSLEFMYRSFLERKYKTVDELNRAQEFGVAEFSEMALTARRPAENMALQDDWDSFVNHVADPAWVHADSAALADYRSFITAPFRKGEDAPEAADVTALNAAYGTSYVSVGDIRLPAAQPQNPKLAEQWRAFLREACPRTLVRVDAAAANSAWIDHLRSKYGSTADLNRAYGLVYGDFNRVVMPIDQADYAAFLADRGHILGEFVTRNYRVVMDLMFHNGRAIFNTILYCALAVIAALLVNPMAAYALSRYKLPNTYRILLFVMLPMAFPPMVLGIPNFLLIRHFGLLNTLAALILPGLASGYSIFLLKGFFDSLPRELYESASLDGASEWTMFWQITMATSKPILAVVALGAFAAAYGNFMMAFILCQDQKMWTMMVNVYQIMQRYNPDVAYAAIVIAALPTLLVFVFCQNIIIRGIVVPTEK